jgi:hypothetical protein
VFGPVLLYAGYGSPDIQLKGLPGICITGRPVMKAQARHFFHLLFFMLVFLVLFFMVTASLAQGLLPLPIGQAFFPYMARQPAAITPTFTPTPTSTSTPTKTPTPTATPVPPSVKVLSGSYSYTGNESSLHIVGEIENQTGRDISNLSIESSLKNSKNKVLASQVDAIYLSYLPAGKRTCFHVIYIDPPSGWSSYTFSEPAYSLATSVKPDLQVTSSDGEYSSSDGEYTLSGKVKNNGNSRVYMVRVIGTLYDSRNKIRGCAYDYIDASSLYLDPDQSSSYSIEFYGRDFSDVDDYDPQPDGYIP